MRDIALIGKAGSGKDTVALLLKEHIPDLHRLAFADPMKEFYHYIFNVPPEPKPRQGYQWFGQEMRKHDPDVWVRQLASRYLHVKERYGGCPVVITDVRQPNEHQWCRENGFVIVRVFASDETRIRRLKQRGDNFKPEDLNHETERYVDEFKHDFLIDNDKNDMDYLRKQIKELAGFLTGRSG